MGTNKYAMWVASVVLALVVGLGYSPRAFSSGRLVLQTRIEKLEQRFRTEVNGWRAHIGDVPGAEQSDFDDSEWESVDIGFAWEPPNSICWFRRWIVVPE